MATTTNNSISVKPAGRLVSGRATLRTGGNWAMKFGVLMLMGSHGETGQHTVAHDPAFKILDIAEIRMGIR